MAPKYNRNAVRNELELVFFTLAPEKTTELLMSLLRAARSIISHPLQLQDGQLVGIVSPDDIGTDCIEEIEMNLNILGDLAVADR